MVVSFREVLLDLCEEVVEVVDRNWDSALEFFSPFPPTLVSLERLCLSGFLLEGKRDPTMT